MRKRIPDRNVWLIFGAIFLLGLGYGVAISVVSLFLDGRGIDKKDIGSLAFWFALGIVSLSLPMGALIRRFSARTTLVASLFGYAAAVTVFPFLPTFHALAAARFLDGACSVGVWVSCETILLSRSSRENKAFVTSLYTVSMALGYVVGPICGWGIAKLLSMQAAFPIAGAVAALAGTLVALRLDADVRFDEHGAPSEAADSEAPALAKSASSAPATSSFALFKSIKTSCFATFAYGYFQSSLVIFLPLYLVDVKGVPREQTILATAFFALGMLLFSNVAGRLGDRYGHLATMRVLAVVGAAVVSSFILLDRWSLMCAVIFVGGATLASISPVSLALQGIIAAPRDYSRANAIYNVFYAAGMLLGPPISGRIYIAKGGVPMLAHLVALWAAFVIFSLIYAGDDPATRRAKAGPTAPATTPETAPR